jgi:hypothetical protein
MPSFALHAWRSMRQAQRSAGFLGGGLATEPPLCFWTFTVWTAEQAMHGFRNTAAHMRAMPRLLRLCDEASYAHWQQDDAAVPAPAVAFARLRDAGKLSKVNSPSAAHAAGKSTAGVEPRMGLALPPRSN